VQRLSCLADIFSDLSELHLSVTVFAAYDKNEAKFKKKIQFWGACITTEIAECFITLRDFLSEL